MGRTLSTMTPALLSIRCAPTVEAYGIEWITRREHLANAKTEAAQLRLHVFPSIGHLELGSVRPRHIRDLISELKRKSSVVPKCRGGKLAPRTIRHVFAVLRLMFKSAVIDEYIQTSPVIVERGVLPKNVDKNPEWRSTAIFTREELVALISDRRIPQYRRVFNALEGLAGLRHGEAAALRWSDYDPTCKPLGRLTIFHSNGKLRTKTQLTREVPVHPALAMLLTDWKSQGWVTKYGREPSPIDLIIPTEGHAPRKSPNTLKAFKKDLAMLGLRARRSHDLRRTFITIAQVDGANRDVLRPMTHPSEQDIVGLYTTFPWPVRCREIEKLRIHLASAADASTSRTKVPSRPKHRRVRGQWRSEPRGHRRCSTDRHSLGTLWHVTKPERAERLDRAEGLLIRKP